MVTVQLFTNSKSDNLGRMGLFSSLTAQNSYFDGLSKISITGTMHEDMGYIEVQKTLTDVMGYSYGRFQISGTWIYFSVRDFEVVNPTKTRILYDVDCWETCRHQYGITLGRGIITRSSRNLNTATTRPFDPVYNRTTTIQTIGGGNQAAVYAYVHDSVNDTNTIYRKGNPTVSGSGFTDPGTIIDGSWIKECGVESMEDVAGMWVSPWVDDAVGWTEIEGAYQCYKMNVPDMYGNWFPEKTVSVSPVSGDQSEIVGFTDLRGNLIWSCDMSDDFPSTINAFLNISGSTCNWTCQLGDSLEGRFTIPCETVTLWNDAFTEYNTRQRQYDMDIRQISLDQQTTQSLGSVGSSVIGGAIAGSAVAPGLGTVVGAIGGAVSGLINTGVTAITQPKFNNRIQQATDALYKRSLDTQILMGDSIVGIVNGQTAVRQVSIETDAGTISRYNQAISSGGYYYSDLEVSDGEPWLIDGALCGDFEILGSIPTAWKEQIRQRFANGVILS